MKIAVVAVAAFICFGQAASAACILKPERMPDDPKCVGLVGYADGARVGFYRSQQGAPVGFGGTCKAGVVRGRQVASNRVSVNGSTWTLTDDCRGTTPN